MTTSPPTSPRPDVASPDRSRPMRRISPSPTSTGWWNGIVRTTPARYATAAIDLDRILAPPPVAAKSPPRTSGRTEATRRRPPCAGDRSSTLALLGLTARPRCTGTLARGSNCSPTRRTAGVLTRSTMSPSAPGTVATFSRPPPMRPLSEGRRVLAFSSSARDGGGSDFPDGTERLDRGRHDGEADLSHGPASETPRR